MDAESDSGQFTTRGMFAIVTGCAVAAAVLRFATISVTALLAGFAVGTMAALIHIVAGAAFDAVERRAQDRWAKRRAAEPRATAVNEHGAPANAP